MNGILFKQRYKAPSVKGVSTLNQKHLEYIATRKGCIYNKDCGFGLWGRAPHERVPKDINDLTAAKKLVCEASKSHTLYRAILSVDKEMAQHADLYKRENWERLVNAHIKVIAKEMNIDEKDFCWFASMHYKKTHPHVHILYWDNSNKPRQAHIPQERFEIMSNHVRAEFNRELLRKEIQSEQKEQKGQADALRQLVQETMSQVDVAAALNLDKISQQQLDDLGRAFIDLVRHVPSGGSLRYQYLPLWYKNSVDALLARVLELPQFSTMKTRYLAATDQISKLYGNDEKQAQDNREKAMKKLYNALGNELMNLVREGIRELGAPELDAHSESLRQAITPTTEKLLAENPKYKQLLEAMPTWRTPRHIIKEQEPLKQIYHELVREIATDLRVRRAAQGYENAQRTSEQCTGEHRTAQEDTRRIFAAVGNIVWQQAEEDKGYQQQLGAQLIMRGLLRLYDSGSRQRNRQQGKLQRSREMSKAAKRDKRNQLSQQGDWDLSM